MTSEEYRSRTKISSVAEAKTHLVRLQILFLVVAFVQIAGDIVQRISDSPLKPVLYVLQMAVILFFVGYCHRIIKLTEDVTKANLLWSIFFTPIGWIWFYPAITKPFKVIIGEMEAPETLPSPSELAKSRENVNKMYWRTMKKIATIAGGVIVVVGIYIAYTLMNK